MSRLKQQPFSLDLKASFWKWSKSMQVTSLLFRTLSEDPSNSS